MLFTPSVQVALRQHLRVGYWLSKCATITPETIKRACKAIAFADAPDGSVPVLMDETHIAAVLCEHQGFTAVVEPGTGALMGWCIPEMAGALQHANQSYQAGSQERSARAKKAAEVRWSAKGASEGTQSEPGVQSTESRRGASDDF